MSTGPFDWARPIGRFVILDGREYEGVILPLDSDLSPNPPPIRMQNGGHVEQRLFRGGSAPLSLRTLIFTLAMQPPADEEDLHTFLAVAARGSSVSVFLEYPQTDEWLATEGQSLFSTSRQLGYGVTGAQLGTVTTTSHPPLAWLNGTPQTIVDTSPSAGEVRLLTGAGAQHNCIAAPALSGGDLLRVLYYPLRWVAVQSKLSHADVASIKWSATLDERLLGGDWT